MIYAYFIVLAVTVLWNVAVGTGSREEPRSHSRRATRLREAAREHHAARGMLETFRDPRSSPIIFVSEYWQQRWWCEKLDVTGDALRAAMREVGPMTADIERHFGAVRTP